MAHESKSTIHAARAGNLATALTKLGLSKTWGSLLAGLGLIGLADA